MRYSSLIILFILFSGCGGGGASKPAPFSIGTVRSTDLSSINLDSKFNSWNTTLVGGTNLEIALRIQKENELGNVFPSQWALMVRGGPDPIGIIQASNLQVKLFENYTQNTQKCCINTLPFSEFDIADISYVAVSGFVDFVSQDKAKFDLNFQQETTLGSGVLTGNIVNVVGCWNIAGEGAASGCKI